MDLFSSYREWNLYVKAHRKLRLHHDILRPLRLSCSVFVVLKT